ncbi:DUF4352 domain-containing protein [Brevibacterium album]|uniref:DUF4352 domain-containing protein n=1 Tax=Brevibacterium album TaxID=417948 RepID=UPI00040C0828|nr:DUF4352 domain-containing protein [Brevibacterium album]
MSLPHTPQPPHSQPHPQGPADPQWAQQWAQQPAQQWAPQPGPPAPAPQRGRPRKPLLKRWWFWVLVVLAVIVIGAALGGGDDSAEDAGGSSAEAGAAESGAEESGAEEGGAAEEEPAAEYGLGDTVVSGDWEVTVKAVEEGVAEVGNEYLGATAQGQFVVVDLAVKNAGSSPEYFFENNITLSDESGNSYNSDSEAGIYADEDALFLEEINPGNTAEGVLVFDVPTEVSPSHLEFQGGIFSEAASVSLG